LPPVSATSQSDSTGRERGRVGDPALLERVGEEPLGQQADVLGEHREDAAHEELGDGLAAVAADLEAVRQLGKVGRDVAGHPGAALGGVEPVRVGEDRAEQLDVRRQVSEEDPVALGVGKIAIVA
jgi:hypothetical protein